jgi:hypothetical protein
MHRPRWIRAAVLVGTALALGAAPPEEEPRPSAWNRFINGAKHALFDRENPRTAGKQPPDRDEPALREKIPARGKTAESDPRGQASARTGSLSAQGRYKRTPPRDSLVRPASAVASDNELTQVADEPAVEAPAEEPVENLPPVARSTRPQRIASKPAQARNPVGKKPSAKSTGREPQKSRSVSEYMAKERP